MGVEEFRNYNDRDYLRWVTDHHRGYVLNIQRTYNPRDARLHLAYCDTITGHPGAGGHFHRRLGQGLFRIAAGTRQLGHAAHGICHRTVRTCHPPGPVRR